MKKKQDAPQISRQKPTLEQWTALYEVAENLKILAPWRALADVDILLLELPISAYIREQRPICV